MIELNKIYNEDCLEGMKRIPDGSVDLVLTDPPYNIAKKNNFQTMGRSGIDFGEWDKGFDQILWLETMASKVSENGSVIIFNGWRNLGTIAEKMESLGFDCKDVIRWKKTNPMPRNRDRRYIVDYEFALWFVNKKAKWVFNRQSETYDRAEMVYPIVGGKEKTGHPTQKPTELMEELLRRHSKVGATVLDPFMGSGTTAIACINTNRNFIGFELDETYFNLANERIANHKIPEDE